MRKLLLIFTMAALLGTACFLLGMQSGLESGAKQMARHLLNPQFRTDKFDVLVDKEKGTGKTWEDALLNWRYIAEHYAGICKWLLEDKPIYGQIVMDVNTVLANCLIVSGSKGASVVMKGNGSGLITNNYFRALDMDWVLSLPAVEPNDMYYDPTESATVVDIDELVFDLNRITFEDCTFEEIDPNKGITIVPLPMLDDDECYEEEKTEDLQLSTFVSHNRTQTTLTFTYNQVMVALQMYAEEQGYVFAEEVTRRFVWWPDAYSGHSNTTLVLDIEPETEPVALIAVR